MKESQLRLIVSGLAVPGYKGIKFTSKVGNRTRLMVLILQPVSDVWQYVRDAVTTLHSDNFFEEQLVR